MYLQRCSVRGEEGTGSWTPVKLGVSNVHIFVPIWMIPEPVREVSTPGVGWSWGSTLTPNYGGLGGGGWNSATQQLVSN